MSKFCFNLEDSQADTESSHQIEKGIVVGSEGKENIESSDTSHQSHTQVESSSANPCAAGKEILLKHKVTFRPSRAPFS